ncbi:hypothetical protein AYY26_21660 [Photobacterium phosphoreum]|nr:hypothetical protein AYY26_21660 [Photobacterium phosphoreum]
MDEQWSFVGAKNKPRWLFYAYDRVKRKVLCHVFGRRTKATLNRLLTLLGHASIYYFMTDAWPVYSSILPAEKHIIGKRWTQRIERYNLNLRTHIKRLNRKTICFSKPDYHRDSASVNNFSGIGGDFAPHLISVLNISSTRNR